ncbi:hypothetical protein [Streptomyces cyaneofuscatus]|uniref:hypothetical protein n=1 Tax=Streptomyces cyaneofuscatus TaxID=66883 RepID=UPI00339E86FF
MASESHLYFVFLVDIEDSGRRWDRAKTVLNDDMNKAVAAALERVGLDLDDVPASDRGDGMLILLPSNLSPPILLRELIRGLNDALTDLGDERTSAFRMRLRAGLHWGNVSRKGEKWTGQAIDHLHELVDSDPARKELRAAEGAHMVFVVSESIYRGVVEGRHTGVDPAAYTRFDFVTKHLEERHGWLTIPEHPPVRGAARAPADEGGRPPRAGGGATAPGRNFVNNGTSSGMVIMGDVHGGNFGK